MNANALLAWLAPAVSNWNNRYGGNLDAKALAKQFDGHCFWCDRELKIAPRNIQLDHIIPHSRGGKSEINNVVFSCPRCNRMKTDMTPGEFFDACLEVTGRHARAMVGHSRGPASKKRVLPPVPEQVRADVNRATETMGKPNVRGLQIRCTQCGRFLAEIIAQWGRSRGRYRCRCGTNVMFFVGHGAPLVFSELSDVSEIA